MAEETRAILMAGYATAAKAGTITVTDATTPTPPEPAISVDGCIKFVEATSWPVGTFQAMRAAVIAHLRVLASAEYRELERALPIWMAARERTLKGPGSVSECIGLEREAMDDVISALFAFGRARIKEGGE